MMPTVAGVIIFVPPLFLLGAVTAGLNKFRHHLSGRQRLRGRPPVRQRALRRAVRHDERKGLRTPRTVNCSPRSRVPAPKRTPCSKLLGHRSKYSTCMPSIKSSPMRPAHIGRFSKTKASAVCCAPCSRFDTRTANVRAYGRLSIWLEKSRKRGNPTWKPFKASGSRQTA